jgi:hypothetical protein
VDISFKDVYLKHYSTPHCFLNISVSFEYEEGYRVGREFKEGEENGKDKEDF